MAYQGRYYKKPQKAKKTPVGLIVLALVLAVLLGLVLSVIIYFNSMLDLIQDPSTQGQTLASDMEQQLMGIVEETQEADTRPVETVPQMPQNVDYGDTGKILNIMLVGQAARYEEAGKLSDTMMLFTLNKETKVLTATSFLRDTYVQLAPYGSKRVGKTRLNSAYALGYSWGGDQDAIYMLSKTIENNFGVKTDFTVEINFDSFSMIVDELGGVTVELDEDEAKYMTNLSTATRALEAGTVTLNGSEALGYARMRHATAADSDMNRVSRQQKVVSSVLEQCRSMSLGQLNSILKKVLPLVMTDMDSADIRALTLEVLPMISQLKMESRQCPAEGTYHGEIIDFYGVPSGVLIPDLESNRQWLLELTEDSEGQNG